MPGEGPTHGDPQKVDGGRTQNKTEGVQGGLGGVGHFGPVGVTVEEGKEGDSCHGQADWKFFIRSDGQSEGQHGDGDSNFHREERDAEHAKDSAHQHERNEGQGNGPDGPASHLGAEDTHAQHGQEVVGAKNGMGEAAGKAQSPMSGVGEEGGGQQAEEKKEESHTSNLGSRGLGGKPKFRRVRMRNEEVEPC